MANTYKHVGGVFRTLLAGLIGLTIVGCERYAVRRHDTYPTYPRTIPTPERTTERPKASAARNDVYWPDGKSPKVRFLRLGDTAKGFQKDLDRLAGMPATTTAVDDKATDFTARDGAKVSAWLGERMKVLVGTDFSWTGALKFNDGANAATLETALNDAVAMPKLFAVNIGSAVSLIAKSRSTTATVTFEGDEYRLRSPRIGIVQVGKGFLSDEIPGSRHDDVANVILRLSTLLHEARHSDGRGGDMGMPHEKCDGSNCDKTKNGSYAVEAEFLRYGLELTERCDESHREALRAALAEALARFRTAKRFADSTPTGV